MYKTADVVTFTGEIPNGKLRFLCSVYFGNSNDYPPYHALCCHHSRLHTIVGIRGYKEQAKFWREILSSV